MEIKTVWAVYFSGTGTTEKTVTPAGPRAGGAAGGTVPAHDYTQPAGRVELSFGPEELVVLGTPVYAGRVPNLMLPYLQSSVHGESTLAVPVVLYGNRNFDDGLIELRNVLSANGFVPIAGAAVVGEHRLLPDSGGGPPRRGGPGAGGPAGPGDGGQGEGPGRGPGPAGGGGGLRPHPPLLHPPGPARGAHQGFPEGQAGDRPGQVREVRPVRPAVPWGPSTPEDVTQVVGKCIKCCACVKKCPMGAKYFDHEGYLYHQHELEDQYAGRRAPTKIFL